MNYTWHHDWRVISLLWALIKWGRGWSGRESEQKTIHIISLPCAHLHRFYCINSILSFLSLKMLLHLFDRTVFGFWFSIFFFSVFPFIFMQTKMTLINQYMKLCNIHFSTHFQTRTKQNKTKSIQKIYILYIIFCSNILNYIRYHSHTIFLVSANTFCWMHCKCDFFLRWLRVLPFLNLLSVLYKEMLSFSVLLFCPRDPVLF